MKKLFPTILLCLLFLPLLAFGADGGGLDGQRILDAITWMGNHPALMVVATTLLTPLLAMIPVVGAPLAMVLTKVAVVAIPAIKQVAKAVEEDSKTRTVSEAATTIVGKLADDPNSIVGQIPGSVPLANIASTFLVRRMRRIQARAEKRASGK